VFIDRFDRQRAIAALRPAIAALKAGTSLVIAPEGTRSPTPRVGPRAAHRGRAGAFRSDARGL